MNALKITLETAYAFALQSAEQGGLFTALAFRAKFPTAEAWFNSLSADRKNSISR